MHEDDAVRLRPMLDAARHAVRLVRGRTRGDLDRDRPKDVPPLIAALEQVIRDNPW